MPYKASGRPDAILEELAERFAIKDKIWGDAWKEVGTAMYKAHPKHYSEEEWQTLFLQMMLYLKINRGMRNFPAISHDSIGDLITYAAMLLSLKKEDVD